MAEKGLAMASSMDVAMVEAEKVLKLHETGQLSREQFLAAIAANAVAAATKRKADSGKRELSVIFLPLTVHVQK